ncbi:hypothetical protein BASA81_007965 [Batrachochytrium salamandrivorans]|nr:hypothetical protein BASA81_007965 [Batrachochytrium salamandrivorans]
MWQAKSNLRTPQAKLPQLPTPQFADTVPLLLQSLEPLAQSKQEFETTKALLLDFASGSQVLQDRLEQRANECRTGVSEFFTAKENAHPELVRPSLHPDGTPFPHVHFLEHVWEDMAYLAWQDSISCFSNVFTTQFESSPLPELALLRAAWVVMGILDFGQQILTGELQPDGGLCSAQYLKILFTTRIPGVERDRIVTRPQPLVSADAQPAAKDRGPFADRMELTSAHICVLSKGDFYSVDVTNVTCEEVHQALVFISQQPKKATGDYRLADLTGMRRDEWSRARVRLMGSSTTSAHSLRYVEEAVFHLVLSELEPNGAKETMLGLQEARGSWLDKSTTIISFKNGVIGANLEHAAADAVVPARMLVHANEFAAVNEPRTLGSSTLHQQSGKTVVRSIKYNQTLLGVDRPQPLQRCMFLPFDVDHPTVEDCAEAAKQLAAIYKENLGSVVSIHTVGTKQIKAAGMAPDSFMQMALQLAFGMDQGGRTPPTYETASTRMFLHGRTECIRSQSKWSKAFVDLYLSGSQDLAKLKELLVEAGQAHRKFLNSASNGRGTDRHMLMLQLLAQPEDGHKHAIFSDPLYVRGTSFELSTSQLPWAVYDHPGFGAPFPNAYGVCYRFSNDKIVIGVACRDNGIKNADRFAANIEKAVHALIHVLTSSAKAKL